MKRLQRIIVYFLLITLMPFLISMLVGFETDCTPGHWRYDNVFKSQVCKETGYEYLDVFLRKADKVVDECLDWTLYFLDNFEKQMILVFNIILNLFYVKEETFADKVYSLFGSLLPPVKLQKSKQICSILVPYVYFGPDGIIMNTTKWRPTCLTVVLTKIVMILLNPMVALAAGVVCLIHENIYLPLKRRYQIKNKYLEMDQSRVKRRLY